MFFSSSGCISTGFNRRPEGIRVLQLCLEKKSVPGLYIGKMFPRMEDFADLGIIAEYRQLVTDSENCVCPSRFSLLSGMLHHHNENTGFCSEVGIG
jgi:hypothetical protein